LRVRTTEYEAHRARKKRTLELILPRLFEVDPKHAERVALCGEQVFIAVCKGCHAKHYVGHNRCMSRFCLDCAHRRSLVYTAKVMDRPGQDNRVGKPGGAGRLGEQVQPATAGDSDDSKRRDVHSATLQAGSDRDAASGSAAQWSTSRQDSSAACGHGKPCSLLCMRRRGRKLPFPLEHNSAVASTVALTTGEENGPAELDALYPGQRHCPIRSTQSVAATDSAHTRTRPTHESFSAFGK